MLVNDYSYVFSVLTDTYGENFISTRLVSGLDVIELIECIHKTNHDTLYTTESATGTFKRLN